MLQGPKHLIRDNYKRLNDAEMLTVQIPLFSGCLGRLFTAVLKKRLAFDF